MAAAAANKSIEDFVEELFRREASSYLLIAQDDTDDEPEQRQAG